MKGEQEVALSTVDVQSHWPGKNRQGKGGVCRGPAGDRS